MRWSGLVAVVVALGGIIATGNGAEQFVDIPGGLFVLLLGCGIITAAHGVRSLILMGQAPFRVVPKQYQKETHRAAVTGRQAFVAAGWIGVLVGVVQMLSALDDPAGIGSGAAVALLTALYGYIFAYLFCLPLERSLSTES